MDVKHSEFTSINRKLAATITYSEDIAPTAGLIKISGGANLPHWPNQWQEWLSFKNIASMGFDFAGVGNSEGKLEETNLSTRLEDSRQAYDLFRDITGLKSDMIYLMGVSMGVPVAIQLAAERQCKGLILASPAAYSEEAWDKNFGEAFSKVIRAEESWKNTIEFETLSAFSGKILMAHGDRDEVVPAAVLKMYSEITEIKGGTKLPLNASHAFLREQSDEVEAKRKIWDCVRKFIGK